MKKSKILVALFFPLVVYGELYEIAWDPPELNTPAVHHYTLYIQDNSTLEWNPLVSVPGNLFKYDWENSDIGEFRFTLTASSADGLESEKSNVLQINKNGIPNEKYCWLKLTGTKINGTQNSPREHIANFFLPANQTYQFFRFNNLTKDIQNSFDLKDWNTITNTGWMTTTYENFIFTMVPMGHK